MVLGELGGRIAGAYRSLQQATVVDDAAVDACLKDICNALMQSDVNVRLVMGLRKGVKDSLASEAAVNRRRVMQEAIFRELKRIVDPGVAPYKPKRGVDRGSVFVFVGLQGAGKTTTLSKVAYYYKKKGFRPGMVCCDTYRAGAYDQLKQNALKVGLPFYGSYNETDPVRLAIDGVARLREEGSDLILVDTSGRHKQETFLLEEMQAVCDAINPDNIVFVMDGSIGQAAEDQAMAFKDAVGVGSVIMTKMDGGGKGGGTLSAVAATKSPVLFIGTGEHMDDLEPFDAASFCSKLLGMGDMKGFVEKMKDAMPDEEAGEAMMKSIMQRGEFSMRHMRDLLESFTRMGSMSSLMNLLPGMSQSELFGKEGDGATSARFKAMMTMMDSMTDKELDQSGCLSKHPTRLKRIAIGSGKRLEEVQQMIEEHKRMEKAFSKLKGASGKSKGPLGALDRNGGINHKALEKQMHSMLPPHMRKQLGGAMNGGLSDMMKQLKGMDPKSLTDLMGGRTGLGAGNGGRKGKR